MKEYKYKINGMKFTVNVGDIIDNEATVEVNGVPYKVELDKKAPQKPQKPALAQSGQTNHGAAAAVSSKPTPRPAEPRRADAIKSPLPGVILTINVKVGDNVKAGDKVCVIESMKMENDIRSPKDGEVKQIFVSVSDPVQEGDDLLVIE